MTTSALNTTATVVELPCVSDLQSLSDDELLALQRHSGALRRQIDAVVAAISGEVARRSDRALGQDGLAARTGSRTPEKAVQHLTGVSLTEARALVAAGSALDADSSPWLAPVSHALESGALSVASAAAIARGLGEPSEDVAAHDLLDAAADLVGFALASTPEHTATAARQLREQLDAERIADLESHRRARRSLRWSTQADGMTRLTGLLDPESAAIITGALDTILSPRRGGPCFVDPAELDRADALATDPRTVEQLAVDALVDVVRLATRAAGSAADAGQLFGTRSPGVRVHVQAADLKVGDGYAYIEGQTAFVSIATAQRLACEVGWLPVLFDGDRCIDAGATQRLHTPRQRVAITAQWNGCAWGDCDRPPWMTEVHHIERWNGTNTTVANGVSLCRFHHTHLHNHGWTLRWRGDELWTEPPKDSTQCAIPLTSRSPFAVRRPTAA